MKTFQLKFYIGSWGKYENRTYYIICIIWIYLVVHIYPIYPHKIGMHAITGPWRM